MKLEEFFENLDDEAMMMAVYRMVMQWSQEHKEPNAMMTVAVRIEQPDKVIPVKIANYIRSKGFYCKQMGCHREENDGLSEYIYSIGVKRTKF